MAFFGFGLIISSAVLCRCFLFRYTDALLKDAIETHYATTAPAAAGSKAAAAAAAALSPPLVMDVGGNHGLFGLFAAALGAQVIMLEPQRALCEVRKMDIDPHAARP